MKGFFLLLIFSFVIFNSAIAQDDINALAEKYIGYYKNNDTKALYESLSEKAKVMPYEQMAALIKVENEILGNLKEYVKVEELQSKIGPEPETTFTTLKYVADFEKGQGVILLVIVKEKEQLKVQTFHIDSPAFLKPESMKILKSLEESSKEK